MGTGPVVPSSSPNAIASLLRFQIGSQRTGDGERGQRTRREVVGNTDDAVDLGSLAVRARGAGGVHEDFDPRTDEIVTFPRRDAVLELAQLGQAVRHQLLV